MVNLKRALHDMIEILKNDSRVRILEFEAGEPLTEQELHAIQRQLGWTLDERFLEFFRVYNGLKLSWVDARIQSNEGAVWEVAEDVLAQGGAAGSIYINSLQEMLFEWSDFESSEVAPGEYFYDILGRWDQSLLNQKLKVFDDFENNQSMGSFYTTGVVIDALYQDPPLLFSDDYMACLDGSLPMLAHHYIEFIACTFGSRHARKPLFHYSSDLTTSLLVPPDSWLDALPEPKDLLATYVSNPQQHESYITEFIDKYITISRGSKLPGAYAHYVDPENKTPSKTITKELEHIIVFSKSELLQKIDFDFDQERQSIFQGYPHNHPIVLPLLQPEYYEATNTLSQGYIPEATLQAMVGSPILFKPQRDACQAACLISVDEHNIWYFTGGIHKDFNGTIHFGHYGLNASPRHELEWIALAIPKEG